MQLLIPFIRYALIALSSYLITSGVSPDLTEGLTTPEMIEAISGVVMAIGTVIWYLYSKSRAALKSETL